MEEVSNMLPKIKSSIRNKLDYKSTTQTNLKNHSRLKDKTENHNLKNQFKIKQCLISIQYHNVNNNII